MYLNEKISHHNYEDPKFYLKELLINCINIMTELNLKNELDFSKSIETIICINTFNKLNNLPLIKYNLSNINHSHNILNLIKQYYDELLYKITNTQYSFFKKIEHNFNSKEYDLIQKTINELRDNIVKSDLLNKDHKENILYKVESLQNELHKSMNSFNNPHNELIYQLHKGKRIKNENLNLDLIESKLYLEYKIKKII